MKINCWVTVFFASIVIAGCGGAVQSTPEPQTWTLTVDSTNPGSGIAITVTPADLNEAGNGSSSFTRTYDAGTTVTLTAPTASGPNPFKSWTGCTQATTVTCTVTMNTNVTVNANFSSGSIAVSPSPATVTIGNSHQFSAAESGAGGDTFAWSLSGPANWTGDLGTISGTGLYVTPYPAPQSVTVTATSNSYPGLNGSATVNLQAPAASAGPALSVDAGHQTHAISSDIYGWNDWEDAFTTADAQAANVPVERWGGDQSTRYNYLLDTFNNAADWYFINVPGATAGYPDTSLFNTQVEQDESSGTKTLAGVPMVSWTPVRNTACSFSVAKYGAQQETAPGLPDCGNGVLLNGDAVVNDPTDTSTPIDQTFAAGWVKYLVGKFGDAANGGVSIYELDNEPEWWDSTQVDIHPVPNTYDELTNDGLLYAQTIKANDPTAEVSGPVISTWMAFFYSKKDIESGWKTGPCYCTNGNPVDRLAHGDTPLIDYYLQHFAAYEAQNGVRLLDYLDLHTYFSAATPNLVFTDAGDTSVQAARLNSTRVFWDPAYTDPNYTDPNNRTSSAPPVPPELIPRAESWIADDYPGTKLAFTEYNWGGTYSINGGVAQADILGIFGSYGLDLATLWWNTYNAQTTAEAQMPLLKAFEVYRNYDGNKSMFGDMSLASTSTNQGALSVYGALRTADNVVTVVVINKTFGDLSSTLSLANLTVAGDAKVYQYSNANLASIVALPDLTVTPPLQPGTTSSISATFPAQSITLFAIPAQ